MTDGTEWILVGMASNLEGGLGWLVFTCLPEIRLVQAVVP
jgi:hypothetical protein